MSERSSSRFTCATLVLHRRDTLLVDSSAARYFADEIEGAQFRELPGADVFPYLGDQDAVLSEIEEFVTGTRRPASSDRFLATVVFTDIVGSTDLAQTQGDARWRDTLNAHHVLAQRVSASYGGRIVDTAGDGALAAFDGPTPAVEYARAFSTAVHELGLRVRVGVHTGEVERRGNDLAGIGVHIGARVAALADSDQILVTSTVRELVFGSPLSFIDRGDHELRGVNGAWHLYELDPNAT